jgi:hypothetical protein
VLFNDIQFRKIRYGFDPALFKTQLAKNEAVIMIQRMFRRKRGEVQEKMRRKKPGYKTLSGVIRSGDLILVYSMLANRAQNRFKLTVKEKTSGTKFCTHQIVRESTEELVKNEYAQFDYPMQGIEMVLKKLLQNKTDLDEIKRVIKDEI